MEVGGASSILFGELAPHEADAAVFEFLADTMPTIRVPNPDPLPLVEAVVKAGLAKSKSEARRQIQQGGIYVNQTRVADAEKILDAGDWLAGGNMLLRKGKKEYALLRTGG